MTLESDADLMLEISESCVTGFKPPKNITVTFSPVLLSEKLQAATQLSYAAVVLHLCQ